MADSVVTITFSKISTPYAGTHGIVKVVIDWKAATGNSVADTAFDSTDLIDILGRYCVLGVTDPGTPSPTDNYDITIEDEYGVDIFGGKLTNRHTTTAQQETPLIGGDYGGRLCAGGLTFKLANNAVSLAKGKCILYFKI